MPNRSICRESSARSRETSGRTYCPRLSLPRFTSPFPTSFSTRLAAVYPRRGRLSKQPTRVAGAHDIENDSDEHLQMFNIDNSQNETISECVGGIYPTLDESLDTFNSKDGSVLAMDDSRETAYNYKWGKCIDEEMAANLSCLNIDAWANLIDMNSSCKTRWAGNKNQLVTSRLVT
ncbi:uncharacterized protein LOC120417891 [Culex pipiens pallens]|uniref:uncharacterized protein LOC120417891 n=1 Tax=Culex pipiens pallens TaxID=42434 RepID=UPI0019532BCD|nr:uncharacterized protein LOC120417891 [Culex pipiens pallens]